MRRRSTLSLTNSVGLSPVDLRKMSFSSPNLALMLKLREFNHAAAKISLSLPFSHDEKIGRTVFVQVGLLARSRDQNRSTDATDRHLIPRTADQVCFYHSFAVTHSTNPDIALPRSFTKAKSLNIYSQTYQQPMQPKQPLCEIRHPFVASKRGHIEGGMWQARTGRYWSWWTG